MNTPPSISPFDADKVMALINAAPGMVFACLLRADGSIAMPFASTMIDALLGLRAEEVELDATPLAQRLHPDDRPAFERSVVVSARGLRHWRREFRYLHPDGSWRWLEARAAPQPRDDGEVIWYGYVHDIAERKRVEARLHDSEARHRRRALQAANLDVEEARRAARHLAAMLADELAAPAQAVRAWAEVGTPAAVQALRAAADRLHQLSADLVDFEQLASGTLSLQATTVDLVPLVGQGVAAMQTVAHAAGVELVVARLPATATVQTDAVRLARVLQALLQRAIDACRDPGRVTVTVAAAAGALQPGVDDGTAAWEVRVNDNAPVPSAAVQAALCPNQWVQAPPTGRLDAPPMPLGLALAAALVPLLGVQLAISPEPAPLAGTRVSLQWPAVVPARPAPPAEAPVSTSRVLYIEDNPVNVILVEQMLARCPGIVLHTASTGAEGIAMARSLRPQLVLLDMQLPDMNGIEVARAMSASDDFGRPSIVGLSADAWAPARSDPSAYGLRGYLTKPVDMRDLLHAVNALLEA